MHSRAISDLFPPPSSKKENGCCKKYKLLAFISCSNHFKGFPTNSEYLVEDDLPNCDLHGRMYMKHVYENPFIEIMLKFT